MRWESIPETWSGNLKLPVPQDNFEGGSDSIVTFHCFLSAGTPDNTPPVVTFCPDNVIQQVPPGINSAVATWDTPRATDASGPVTVTSTHQPGSAFPVGTTRVTYTFTDSSGNINTCSFSVDVRVCKYNALSYFISPQITHILLCVVNESLI